MSSDILRYRILYKYGGLYVDATDVQTTPDMNTLNKIPGWDEMNPHTLYIDPLSQNRNPTLQDLKEFRIPIIPDLTGDDLDAALSQSKIGNDTFICSRNNPLMLKMIEIAERGFECRSLDEMIHMTNTLHNISDSTISITGPEVPQKAICLASTGKLTPGIGGSVIKHIDNDVVLIRPVRCETYQLTSPIKNTRNWNNVSIDTTVILNAEIAFEKIGRMINFEIEHMGILRLDDHLRDLVHVAKKLNIEPNKVCDDFLRYLEGQQLPIEKVKVVQNVRGDPQVQEFYKRHNLIRCDFLRDVTDLRKAFDFYQDITCFNLFMRTPMFTRINEITTVLINRYQFHGEQRAVFDKVARAVSFIYHVKFHQDEVPAFHSFLQFNPKFDLTQHLGAIMSKFTPAFLEPNKEISKSQVGDVLNKLIELGVNNSIIQEYLEIRQLIKTDYKGDPNICLRNLSNSNQEKKLVKLLLYFDVNIDSPSLSNGQTALHYAASKGHVNVVKLLLTNGADAAIIDGNGKTPRDIAPSSCQDLFSSADFSRTAKK